MKTLARIVKERAAELEGKWVALGDRERWINELAGREVDPMEAIALGEGLVIEEVLDSQPHSNAVGEKVLFVSDKPFAVKWVFHGYPELGVVKSQQVSNGERGRLPQVPMPRFVRGAAGWGWVRLSDLGFFLRQYCPHQLWDKYFKIGHHGDQRRMEVCIGSPQGPMVEVGRHRISWPCTEAADAGAPCPSGGYEIARIWVPAGWAADVCYLVQFERLDQERRRRMAQAQSRAPSP